MHLDSRGRDRPFEVIWNLYFARLSALTRASATTVRGEAALLDRVGRERGRVPALLVLLDSRGRQLSSQGFSQWLGAQRDGGLQTLILAVGPADGWSEEARGRAGMLLSLGPMTLPHELARLVLVEQVYRAFTILAGHPYHSGH